MSDSRTIATSPLLFLHPVSDDGGVFEALRSRHFGPPTFKLVELINFFCRPQPISAGIAAGHSADEIAAALDAGILREVADEAFTHAFLWEERRWSRPAFLNFLKRKEACPAKNEGHSPPSGHEFEQSSGPTTAAPFPARRLVPCESPFDLPSVPDDVPIDWDAVMARRCARRFLDEPIALEAFTSILFESTRSYREAERRRAGAGPGGVLDPWLVWLEVYVVVQRVAGLDRAVYQYDPMAHQLRFVGPNQNDRDIAACVHGQWWIGGSGFCLFAVADWERLMWIERQSHAYLDLLVQIGEFSQEVLFPVSRAGLGAWMTPAIYETIAARLFCLENMAQDAVFFMKVGPPRPAV